MTARNAAKKKRASPRRNHASEIAPGVFVGGWSDAEQFTGKRYCVLDETPSDAPADQGLPIYDDALEEPIVANLDRIVELMKSARAHEEPVLVFCGHGIRRSPLAGAWYLHRTEGLPLDEAYSRLQSVRPKVEHAREWITHWEVLGEGRAMKPRAPSRN